jgi:hypothetical protein
METYLLRAKSYYTILLKIYPNLYQQLTRFDRIKSKISKKSIITLRNIFLFTI